MLLSQTSNRKKPQKNQKRKRKKRKREDKEEEDETSEEPVFEGIAPPIGTPKIQIPFPVQQQNQQQLEDQPEYENSVTIPGIDYEMPLPSTEVMVTAATTASIAAVVSVTGTLAAKTVFDYLLKLIKPALKIAVNKLAKARGKPTTSWARQRLQERRHK
jgi:septal ring-binding cell division protein DamX